MKKRLILLCLLLLVSAAALCLIEAQVISEHDRVTVTEQELFGDPAAASGALVRLNAHLDEHLLWDMTFRPGGKVQTDYTFSARKMDFDRQPDIAGIHLYEDIEYGLDTRKTFEDLVGLECAYYELFRDTAAGTKGTRTVQLQDYYTYYPIRVEINLPGTLWHSLDYEDTQEAGFENERAVWDKFREFFKIPIPADLPAFEISIVKNADGSIGGAGSSAPKEGASYNFYTASAYTEDACYLTVNNRYGDGYIDTSLIPGGYGIYRFTYKNVRNDKNTQGNATVYHPGFETGVDADSLKMVYPLDEALHVNTMKISPDGTRLFVLAEDRAGFTHLIILDLATMTEVQTISIESDSYVSLHTEEDFFVLFYGQYLSLYEESADGTYTHAITGDQPNYRDEHFSSFNTYCAMDFDGERLILVDILTESRYHALQTCNLCLAVYDGTGLCYYGEYQNGLSVNPDTSRYDYNIIPLDLSVEWS